ncbi:MAG: hypothetical protein K6F25_01290 [Bacteroidales bacterium]|nr:hypothetical protein [Bacteroidales bacterium]
MNSSLVTNCALFPLDSSKFLFIFAGWIWHITLYYWYKMECGNNKIEFTMEEKYEKPVVRVVLTELRDTVLGTSGDEDPWGVDDD